MNVILIISDTLRRDHLGCYGNPWIRTPHLDAFARRCLVFDRAYCGSFPTVPARNDILTGRWTFAYKSWAPLGGDEVTLQETLNAAGVFTGLVGDTPHPFAAGFNYQRNFQTWEVIRGQEGDHWRSYPKDPSLPAAEHKLRHAERNVKQYLRNVHDRRVEADYFSPRTMRAAERWLERSRDRAPFFLYVDTFDPHEPWDPPQHYVDLYDPGYCGEEVIYPRYDRCDYLSSAELRHCQALYAGEVTMVDTWIGRLLDRAQTLGVLDDTAVIITADHGFYLGEHGYIGKTLITPEYQQPLPLYPEVCHVPLLVYMPGIAGRRRTAALVNPVDLYPTICDLLGVSQRPSEVQGQSFLPVLGGHAESVRRFSFSSPTLSSPNVKVPHPTSRCSINDGEWLLVYGSQVEHLQDEETTRMVDDIMRTVKTLEKGPIRPELYHLASDPGCLTNVLAGHREEAERLHRAFVCFLEQSEMRPDHRRFFQELP